MDTTDKKRWTVLAVVVLMSFMSCLDASIVNIALPTIRESLSAKMADVEWAVTAYLMTICATILIFGRLGDLRGKTRIFRAGAVIFTIGSLACGMSESLATLVAFRVLQGVGAAAYMANNQGIITATFKPGERGRALGILATAVALGTMLGPVAGGLIVATFNWRFIFFINIPLGMIACIAGAAVLPKEEVRHERFDCAGAGLFLVFILALIGGLTFGQTLGFSDYRVIASLVASIPAAVAFILVEKRTLAPILKPALFRNRQFSVGIACAIISYVCLNASVIILPFYLQIAHGLDPARTGFIMMVSPLVVALLSPVSGVMTDRLGAEGPSFAGLALMCAGFLLMGTLNATTPIPLAIACFVILAVGQGFFQPSNNTLIMSSVSRNELGVAGSVNSLSRNVGQALGVTAGTTLLYLLMSRKAGYAVFDYVPGRNDVFIYAMKRVYAALALFCLIGASFTFARFRLSGKKTAALFR
jgi:EmrB/QacA subfamily drug resistance transporter